MPQTQLGRAPRTQGPVRQVWATLRPRRRLATMAFAAPIIFALLATRGPWPAPAVWVALVGLLALMAGAVLATYLPEQGRRLQFGCTPCAMVAVATVPVATGLVATSPQAMDTVFLALGVLTFGLFQRLNGSGSSCPI